MTSVMGYRLLTGESRPLSTPPRGVADVQDKDGVVVCAEDEDMTSALVQDNIEFAASDDSAGLGNEVDELFDGTDELGT